MEQNQTDTPSQSHGVYLESGRKFNEAGVCWGCQKVGRERRMAGSTCFLISWTARMRTTGEGPLFLYTGGKDWVQRGQAYTQGHTATQHGQGLEPGLSLLGPESHRRKGDLTVLLQSLYLRSREYQESIKKWEGMA